MSLGGYLAQLVALKYPGRVITLTLVASERLADADPDLPQMSPEILAYHAAAWRLLSGSAHGFDETHIRSLAAADFTRTPDSLTPMNHALISGGEAWHGRLSEIVQPALIIHGTEDPILSFAHGRALERDLPNAMLLPLPGSGHELHPADWPIIIDASDAHTGLG